jgi:hypothetical protein
MKRRGSTAKRIVGSTEKHAGISDILYETEEKKPRFDRAGE